MRLPREWAGPDGGWAASGTGRPVGCWPWWGGRQGPVGQEGEWARSVWELSKKMGGLFKFLMPKTKDTQNHSFWRDCLFLPLFSEVTLAWVQE